MSRTELATISEIQGAIASRQISAAELAEDRISRIQAYGVKPFVVLEREAAMKQARTVDQAVARGADLGLIAGVPLAHKDMFDRAGHIVRFGANASASRLATTTAPVLSRLDHAGQVDLGRLMMSEFALGPTGHNAQIGMPKNPRVNGAITGGSSSGSGAAVAAGLVAGALGSDTGGSIRLPAACCGVVGFKPTQGRVPLTSVMPLSPTQDCVGPLAHTVADARTLLRLISGPDDGDATCRAHNWQSEGLAKSFNGLRIGFDDGRFLRGLHPDTLDALNETWRVVQEQGGKIRECNLTFFEHLGEPANVIAMSEASAIHANRLATRADDYGPQVRARLVQAAAIPAQAYLRALQIRSEAIRRMHETVFATVDILILPTLPGVPPLDATSDVADGPDFSRLISEMTRLTRPASILGLPALSLPVVWTDDGPISLQIIGPQWSDALVADVAEALEVHFSARPSSKITPENAKTLTTAGK